MDNVVGVLGWAISSCHVCVVDRFDLVDLLRRHEGIEGGVNEVDKLRQAKRRREGKGREGKGGRVSV